ncbi:hypothetical protein A2W13_01125 [Candidatus Woesebacteria bacterium RBG_16_36_11]|nr:MAG: hypothetical protein A2Z67_03130 [Candidatus Woesebacteria bacterium RBG_13_36_22]OGM12228.1 MAG: hypothetical protein A2W13_01125 [Candidatus Woesebacteria bacterium RBG_16_36_11]
MDFNVASVKITGNPDTGGWTQVHDFKPDDTEKLKVRGHLFAVIATSDGESGMRNVAAGREILARLHEEYFGNLKTSAFYALKDAVEKVTSEFKASLNENIEIAAAAFVEGVLYTACGGGTQAEVYRNNMVAKILISKGDEVVSASGYPQEKDIFLLGTSSFFKVFTDGIIKANLEGGSLEKANESFAGTIHSLPDSGNCAVVIISFTKSVTLPVLETEERISNQISSTKFTSLKPQIVDALNKFRNRFSKNVYVKREEFDTGREHNRKTVFSVGIILLILLFVSIGFGIKQKKDKDLKASYIEKLNQASHNFEESQKLITLDPIRSRELFADTRSIVNELISKGIKDENLVSLKAKIAESEGSILGEYKITPQLYLDLALLSNSFKGDKMVSSSEDLAVLDINARKVVEIVIESKKSKVVLGPDMIKDVKDLAIYSNRVFVLSSDGVYEVGDKANKIISNDWGENVLIYAYAANIYMLDITNNKIYRFSGAGTTFGSKQNWLGLGENYDFADFKSWTIDGSIWIASNNAQIKRFVQGVRDSFEIKGLSPSINAINAIYTNEELEYLYILDSENSRVVAIDKEGEFKAQYSDPMLKNAKTIITSEKEKKIIFLTDDSKLYSIEMKHL